jgi:hypothetical protein
MSSERARAYFRQADSIGRGLATVQRALDLGYANVAARLLEEIRTPYEAAWKLAANYSPHLEESARAWGVAIERMELRVQEALRPTPTTQGARDARP